MAHVLRTALTKLTGSATEGADDKENGSPNTSESGPNSLTPATESKDGVEEKVSPSPASGENDNDATREKPASDGNEKTPEVKADEDESPADQSDNYLTGTKLASLTFGLALVRDLKAASLHVV